MPVDKKTTIILSTFTFLLIGLAVPGAAQLDNTDKALSVADREGKNSDRIDLVVRPSSFFDRISNFLDNALFSVAFDQDEVNRGDTVTGEIYGDIGAVAKPDYIDPDSEQVCDGDQVDIRVRWEYPDGSLAADDYITADECSDVEIDYSFDVWSDAEFGEWTVTADYSHSESGEIVGPAVKDFGETSYEVVEEEEPEPPEEPDEPEQPDEPDEPDEPVDSDGDGVNDENDECPGTPSDAQVTADGCAVDFDGDGVPDIYDDCPAEAGDGSDGCPVEPEEPEPPEEPEEPDEPEQPDEPKEPEEPTDTDPEDGDGTGTGGLQGIDQAIVNFLTELFGGLFG